MALNKLKGSLHAALVYAVGSGFAAAAPAQPASGQQCYPGTANSPLEGELILDGSGGTFWEVFKDKVVKPFEAKCGVKVTLTVNPSRPLSQVYGYIERGQVPWDISFLNKPWEIPQGEAINAFNKLPDGFWDPLKGDLLDNSYSELGTWLSSYSNVLIYNPKVFPQGMKSWADFWDTRTYPGPRTMQNNPLNIIAALLAAGVKNEEMYPITDDKLRQAFTKLNEIRPQVSSFWTSTDQPIQGVHRGDFVAGIAYSGRANAGILRGYDLAINWNENIFDVAWFFRPRGSKNPQAAAAFLYFFNGSPDLQAEVAKQTGYSYANKNMEKFLSPDEVKALATSHKAEGAVVNTGWWAENGPRVTKLWNEWVASGKVPL
jgi:putative spermidine/putrescine transport system substrate-binding protein